jgi:lysophospholipase L1-like esterase
MKSITKFVVLIAFIAISMSMAAEKKTRIVFFGDSITQMGVNTGGYIKRIEEDLQKRNVSSKYELIGAGVGGNKVYDLYLRMEEDVLAKNPDVVVVWVGVNDVWHKTSGIGTDPEKFQRFYEAIIKKLQAKNIKVILTTPAAIGERTDNTNQQDGDLNLYSNIIRKLAKDFNCSLVDLRKEFIEYNIKNNTENKESGILTTDRVHLTDTGNKLVAEKMLDVILATK